MLGQDELIADSLALVNVVRRAFGVEALNEFPEATRGDAGDCLFYRALGDLGVQGVSGSTVNFASERVASTAAILWGTERSGNQVVAPPQISEVVNRFDSRKYPHYLNGRRD